MLKHFSITPPENSGGADKSTENSGSMYEMSQRHPDWVTENHVNPCNSAAGLFTLQYTTAGLQCCQL
jgi:hypothetical protein